MSGWIILAVLVAIAFGALAILTQRFLNQFA